jgi:hypothetical protein
VAIGSAGTGASIAAPSPSGRPCCQEGGGCGCADCAAGLGGLARGCEPGPAPGWAEGGTAGCTGGEGFTAGCCAASGDGMAVRTTKLAASHGTRERNDAVSMTILPNSTGCGRFRTCLHQTIVNTGRNRISTGIAGRAKLTIFVFPIVRHRESVQDLVGDGDESGGGSLKNRRTSRSTRNQSVQVVLGRRRDAAALDDASSVHRP